jgi:hypothetical protein
MAMPVFWNMMMWLGSSVTVYQTWNMMMWLGSSVTVYQTTWYNIPENNNLHNGYG